MDLFYKLLLVFHIGGAALWLGSTLGVPGRVRRGLEAGGLSAQVLADDLRKTRFLALAGVFLASATGIGLIFVLGGFAVAPRGVHIALGLMGAGILVELALLQPTCNRIRAGIAAERDLGGAAAAAKRLAPGYGIVQLLWLAMLAMMIWKSV